MAGSYIPPPFHNKQVSGSSLYEDNQIQTSSQPQPDLVTKQKETRTEQHHHPRSINSQNLHRLVHTNTREKAREASLRDAILYELSEADRRINQVIISQLIPAALFDIIHDNTDRQNQKGSMCDEGDTQLARGGKETSRTDVSSLPTAASHPLHVIPGLRSSLHFQSERHMPGLEDPDGHSEPASSAQQSPIRAQTDQVAVLQPVDEEMAAIDAFIDAVGEDVASDPGPARGMAIRPPQGYDWGAGNFHTSGLENHASLRTGGRTYEGDENDRAEQNDEWVGRYLDAFPAPPKSSTHGHLEHTIQSPSNVVSSAADVSTSACTCTCPGADRDDRNPRIDADMCRIHTRPDAQSGSSQRFSSQRTTSILSSPPRVDNNAGKSPRKSPNTPQHRRSRAMDITTIGSTLATYGTMPAIVKSYRPGMGDLLECSSGTHSQVTTSANSSASRKNPSSTGRNTCRPAGTLSKRPGGSRDDGYDDETGGSSSGLLARSNIAGRGQDTNGSAKFMWSKAMTDSNGGSNSAARQAVATTLPVGHASSTTRKRFVDDHVSSVPLCNVSTGIQNGVTSCSIPSAASASVFPNREGIYDNMDTRVRRNSSFPRLEENFAYPRQSTYWAGAPGLHGVSSGQFRMKELYRPDPIGTPRQPHVAGAIEQNVPDVSILFHNAGNASRSQLSATAPEFTSHARADHFSHMSMKGLADCASQTTRSRQVLSLDREVAFNATELVGRIITSNDQQASIFLQQKLKLTTIDQKYDIITACIGGGIPLMSNRFGNFLVQRCFEHATPDQVIEFAKTIVCEVKFLAMDAFGCHVVQKAFDSVPEKYKTAMVLELLNSVRSTIVHRYGCHVWQKLFELRWGGDRPPIMACVNQALKGMWVEVALGETGSLVVQNIFENCLEAEKRDCIEEILQDIDLVAYGQFGNWCIQHLCEHGGESDKGLALEHVLCHAVEYSTDQYASKVVEKCLKTAGTAFTQQYLDQLCERIPNRPRVPLIDGTHQCAARLDRGADAYSGERPIWELLDTTHTCQLRNWGAGSNLWSRSVSVVGSIWRGNKRLIRKSRHLVSMRGSKHGSRVANMCCAPPLGPRRGPTGGRSSGGVGASGMTVGFR